MQTPMRATHAHSQSQGSSPRHKPFRHIISDTGKAPLAQNTSTSDSRDTAAPLLPVHPQLNDWIRFAARLLLSLAFLWQHLQVFA